MKKIIITLLFLLLISNPAFPKNYGDATFLGDVDLSSANVTMEADSVTEASLKAVNSATDEYCLTYESTVGDFEWQVCSTGTGDLLADGTVPLTADWDVGDFDITLHSLTGDGTVEGAILTEGGQAVYNASDFPAILAEDGAEEMFSETMGTECTENQVLKGDGTGGWVCGEDNNDGGATAYDDIGDPDADATIAFGSYDNTWTSTMNGGTVFGVQNTTADVTAETFLLQLQYADISDADAKYIKCNDGARTVFSVGDDGNIVLTGNLSQDYDALYICTGDSQDTCFTWNETDDVATFYSIDNNAADDDYALITMAVDIANSGVDADQEVFEVGKGAVDDSEANFTELFSVDEDGDIVAAGNITAGSTISDGTASLVGGVLSGASIDDDSNAITNIDGENIKDDTIDDDSIDFGDVTCADLTMTDCGNITTSGTVTMSSATVTLPSTVKNQRHVIAGTIINPNGAYGTDTSIMIWDNTDANLTITKLTVTLDATTNQVAGDLKYADAFIGKANATVINAFDTTTGVLSDDSITSGSVASGKDIYLTFDSKPSADIKQMSYKIEFDYD